MSCHLSKSRKIINNCVSTLFELSSVARYCDFEKDSVNKNHTWDLEDVVLNSLSKYIEFLHFDKVLFDHLEYI